MFQSGQSPFNYQDTDNEQGQWVIEPNPVHRQVRAVSRMAAIVSGVMTFSILARILPAIAPLYGVAIGVGVCILLATLLFGKGYEARLFSLIIAALTGGGLLLGWWDWLWFIFNDASGTSSLFQALIVGGVVVLAAVIYQAIRQGGQDEQSD